MRISLPALNFTVARAGMGTSVSGLFGLRPTRALRILISKTPKLRNSTLSPFCERLGDVIQRFLHHVKNLLLGEAGFPADADDEVAFG